MQLILGTRGSKLALWQTAWVKNMLVNSGWESTVSVIESEGDKIQDKPLYELQTVGVFTKALDTALRAQKADLAVHSCKDLPATLDDDLEIIAYLEREDPRDAWLALSPDIHPENFSREITVGTSALRRQALLTHFCPQVRIAPLRGNVDTRLAKLESGAYDAIILAYAGVKRMGLQQHVVKILSGAVFTPAAGQGTVAVVARKDAPWKEEVRKVLNHPSTEIAVKAERAFLKGIEGGCKTPVFALATLVADSLTLTAGVAAVDGSGVFRQTATDHAENGLILGETLAQEVLSQVSSSSSTIRLL